MRVLRGVVYMTKSSGPRTEPWGTPQEEVLDFRTTDIIINSDCLVVALNFRYKLFCAEPKLDTEF